MGRWSSAPIGGAGPSPLAARRAATQDRPIATETTAPASFDLLPLEECYGLLSSTTVGRVAFAGPDGLVLRPVNYRVAGGDVYLRTSTTGVLAGLVRHRGEVLFEVDYHAATSREGWSVLVRGTCTRVPEPEVAERLATPELRSLVPWPSVDRDLLLRIHPDLVTGRKVG